MSPYTKLLFSVIVNDPSCCRVIRKILLLLEFTINTIGEKNCRRRKSLKTTACETVVIERRGHFWYVRIVLRVIRVAVDRLKDAGVCEGTRRCRRRFLPIIAVWRGYFTKGLMVATAVQ